MEGADQARKALRPMLLARTASAANVALLFSISDRVLRGRLTREGTPIRRRSSARSGPTRTA